MYLALDVFELHDCHSNQAIVPSKAIIFGGNVKLIRGEGIFVTQHTGNKDHFEPIWTNQVISDHLQVEHFVELGSPLGRLVLCLLQPSLVRQMGPNQVHLYERLEGLSLRPLEIVSGNHWKWTTVNSDHLWWSFLNRSLTFHSDLVLASPRMSVEVHLNWNLSGALVLVLFVCKQILLTLFCKHMFTIVYLPWLFWLWTKFLMSASVVWV